MKYSAIILALVATMVAAQAAPPAGAARPKVIRAPCGTSCVLPILKSSKCEPAAAAKVAWTDQAPAAGRPKSSPQQIAAVRDCFCKAPGLHETFASCVPQACAKTHGKTTTLVGRFNAMCAKTQGFTTIAVPPPAAAAPA